MLNDRGAKPQAAVVSVTRAFEFPAAERIGQSRGRPALSRRLPDARLGHDHRRSRAQVVPMDKGLLLRFDGALDAKQATNPSNYTVTSWHYKRTYKYGRRSSRPTARRASIGSCRAAPTSRRMGARVHRPAGHQAGDADARRLDARHRRRHTVPGERVVHALRAHDVRSEKEGFGKLTVDLSPKTEAAPAAGPGERGRGPARLRALRVHRLPRAKTRRPSRSSARTSRGFTDRTARSMRVSSE